MNDDRDIVFLNGNSSADNQTLRGTRGLNHFNGGEFTAKATVSDLTGLTAAAGNNQAQISGAESVALNVSVNTPQDSAQSIVVQAPGELGESIEFDSQTLLVTACRWTTPCRGLRASATR